MGRPLASYAPASRSSQAAVLWGELVAAVNMGVDRARRICDRVEPLLPADPWEALAVLALIYCAQVRITGCGDEHALNAVRAGLAKMPREP